MQNQGKNEADVRKLVELVPRLGLEELPSTVDQNINPTATADADIAMEQSMQPLHHNGTVWRCGSRPPLGIKSTYRNRMM